MTLRRNIIANVVGQAYSALLALALVPVYVRLLGIEAYALVGLFASLQVWMTLLDLGMTPTLSREMARFTAGATSVQFIRDLLRTLEWLTLAIVLVIAVGLTLAAGWVAADWLRAERLPPQTIARALSLTGLVVGLRFAEAIYRSGISGLQQQVWLNGAAILLATLRHGGAVLVLVFVATSIEAFFVWQAVVSLVALAAYAAKLHLALPRAPRPPRFSSAALAEVRGFAGGMIGIALLATALTQLDKLLLSSLLPLADFGRYMLAATLTSGLLLVSGPVVLAASPALAALAARGDEARLAPLYHANAQLVTVLLAPAALLVAIFPYGLLFAWSGDAALAAATAPILAMLAVGTALNGLMQVPHQLQLAAGWTRLAFGMNVAAVALLVPALLWSAPRFGAPAAAAVWAGLNAGYVLVTIPLMHRRLLRGAMWRWYGVDVLVPAAGAAAALGVAWLARPGPAADRVVWVVFLVGAGLLALVAAVAAAPAIRGRLVDALNVARRRRRQRV